MRYIDLVLELYAPGYGLLLVGVPVSIHPMRTIQPGRMEMPQLQTHLFHRQAVLVGIRAFIVAVTNFLSYLFFPNIFVGQNEDRDEVCARSLLPDPSLTFLFGKTSFYCKLYLA